MFIQFLSVTMKFYIMFMWLVLIVKYINTAGMFSNKVHKARFAKIQCKVEDPKKVVIKNFCYVKNYSRDVSTASFGLVISIQSNKFYVEMSLKYKFHNYYR